MSLTPLTPEQLYTACDTSTLSFSSSKELSSLEPGFGQQRALESINFALGMPQPGYHLFLSGHNGLGRIELIQQLIQNKQAKASAPYDWCYVNNFQQNDSPILLRLKAGQARQLQKQMLKLIEDLLDALPSTFQSEEYLDALREVNEEFQHIERQRFESLSEEAKKDDIVLVPTPKGYTMGPSKDGEILDTEEFNKLEEEFQKIIKEKVEVYNDKLKAILEKSPQLKIDAQQKIKDLNTWFALLCVQPFFERLKSKWDDEKKVVSFIEDVQENIIDNLGVFFRQDQDNTRISNNKFVYEPEYLPYHVNIFVDNSRQHQAPIIYEDNPNHSNVFGQVEYTSYNNVNLTNFTLMQAGALHRANGGYLILDARKVLSKPFVWETLKRVLEANQIGVENAESVFSFGSAFRLKPEMIPLDVKVILIGDASIHHLLKTHDPEFDSLFKVTADMSNNIDRNEESTLSLARLIAEKITQKNLTPFDSAAMGKVIEYSARISGNSHKLSLDLTEIADLLSEANYYAVNDHAELVQYHHIEKALEQRNFRHSKYSELFYESLANGDILFCNQGKLVGESNALSVIQIGNYYFGRPTRLSATARLGGGNVIDIEREADMAGSLHSKGVMILSAFLANRYAKDIPFALNATLVFEQSYGYIDGDSASAIELCTLLSAITDIPIKQNFAATGSVDQKGRVQAIGGVNEKIEGFFNACIAVGPVNGQAVIIPQANVKHLMLKKEVIDAVENKVFNIFAVDNIDDMLQLLTGVESGARDNKGKFPEGSFNESAQSCIFGMSEKLNKIKER